MKPQAFQPGELRDEYDQIIRAGAYGKKTPFVNSDNSAILDYIMNNFDALYAQIPNGRAYVKSVNNITPDSNGNVTVNVGSGGDITVDSTLSSTSTNPVQNKVIYAALNNKLDKNGTATYAVRDSSGNIISSTYAKKTDLSSYVKSINNVKPDSAGNVNISTGGGGSNITVDTTLDSTSSNAIANKAVYAALNNKLDKTGTAAAATKATQDSYGNVIVNTYARKSDLSSYVKTINNQEPDANGNINISTGGGGSGSNITVDAEISSTSTNPVQNKAIYSALMDKVGIDEIFNGFALRSPTAPITWMQGSQTLGSLTASNYTGTALRATQDSDGNIINTTYAKKSDISALLSTKLGVNSTAYAATRDGAGNNIVDTYAKKTDVSGMVKSVNNVKPDSNGNVAITVSGGGTNITVDTALSAASTNPVQNRVVKTAIDTVTASIPTKVSTLENDAGYLTFGNLPNFPTTDSENIWDETQIFQTAVLRKIRIVQEVYTADYMSGTAITPTTSTMCLTATGAVTLDMATIVTDLLEQSRKNVTVFTAYIISDADYTLTITNAGTIKYIGSASDVAITSAGLLLNIMMLKDASRNLTSIVQASKLS